VRKRLSWELAMEFGFNARVGRTLDKVGCSTAILDETLLVPALRKLHLALTNKIGLLRDLSFAELRHFVPGLLSRSRTRGAVSHELLPNPTDMNDQSQVI